MIGVGQVTERAGRKQRGLDEPLHTPHHWALFCPISAVPLEKVPYVIFVLIVQRQIPDAYR